jgi:hypothetical protein
MSNGTPTPRLTSRKLAAAIVGVVAVVVSFGFVVFGDVGADNLDRVLLSIVTITLAAIGTQAVIDQSNTN